MNNISFKDKYFLLHSNLLKKRNILLFIILVLVILILLLCFNLIFFVGDFQEININKNVDMRTLLVYSKDDKANFNDISNLKHVVYNNSTKFYGSTGIYSEEFNNKETKGFVAVYPLLLPKELKIINGRSIQSDNEAVCPTNFYPHSIYINENSDIMRINPEYYLNTGDIIGKKFTIKSNNPENENITVKIVGLYNSEDNLKPINGCYISETAYDQIVSPYEATITNYLEDGSIVTENIDYTGNIVIIDEYKNVKNVKNKLEEMGFSVSSAFYIDNQILKSIFTIPLLISLIVIILSLNIIYSFINKKVKYRLPNYGILKTIGYNKRIIISIDTLENIIVFIFSFIIAFLLYIAIYTILMNTILVEYVYNNLTIHIPFLYIIIFVILFIIIITIMCKSKLNKVLNQPIRDLLGE